MRFLEGAFIGTLVLAAGCGGGSGPGSADNSGDGGNPSDGGGTPVNISAVVPSVEDVFVSSAAPMTNFDSGNLDCSYCYQTLQLRPAGSANGETRVYLKYRFDTIPVPVTVIDASLRFEYLTGTFPNSDDALSLAIYETTGAWSESQITWAGQPPNGSLVLAQGTLSGKTFNVRVGFDESVVQKWLDSPILNLGIVVIPQSGSSSVTQKVTRSHELDGVGVSLELRYVKG
jgi:hypothetical protein